MLDIPYVYGISWPKIKFIFEYLNFSFSFLYKDFITSFDFLPTSSLLHIFYWQISATECVPLVFLTLVWETQSSRKWAAELRGSGRQRNPGTTRKKWILLLNSGTSNETNGKRTQHIHWSHERKMRKNRRLRAAGKEHELSI